MIGRLLLPVLSIEASLAKGEPLSAWLRDDLTWRCSDPEWATMLNAQFPAPQARSVSAGRFLLYRAAERLSARVVLNSPREAELA